MERPASRRSSRRGVRALATRVGTDVPPEFDGSVRAVYPRAAVIALARPTGDVRLVTLVRRRRADDAGLGVGRPRRSRRGDSPGRVTCRASWLRAGSLDASLADAAPFPGTLAAVDPPPPRRSGPSPAGSRCSPTRASPRRSPARPARTSPPAPAPRGRDGRGRRRTRGTRRRLARRAGTRIDALWRRRDLRLPPRVHAAAGGRRRSPSCARSPRTRGEGRPMSRRSSSRWRRAALRGVAAGGGGVPRRG